MNTKHAKVDNFEFVQGVVHRAFSIWPMMQILNAIEVCVCGRVCGLIFQRNELLSWIAKEREDPKPDFIIRNARGTTSLVS